jgi:hypothetical protein
MMPELSSEGFNLFDMKRKAKEYKDRAGFYVPEKEKNPESGLYPPSEPEPEQPKAKPKRRRYF